MNPCPCGNLYSLVKECRCKDSEIKSYRNKLSEPFLDRIDLFVKMEEAKSNERIHSKDLFNIVLDTFKMQKERGQIRLNGKLNDDEIEKFCILDDNAKDLLNQAINRFGLSHRGRVKVIKLSRSIADIDKSEIIKRNHLLEALSFRAL